MKSDKEGKQIIIEGITESGEVFRPGDWAERITDRLATFEKHRIRYSPLLKPGVKNGTKCVFIDESLKEKNPELYQQLLEFAKTNKLKVGGSQPLDEEK